MKNTSLSEFTRQYQITKTLRFELKQLTEIFREHFIEHHLHTISGVLMQWKTRIS